MVPSAKASAVALPEMPANKSDDRMETDCMPPPAMAHHGPGNGDDPFRHPAHVHQRAGQQEQRDGQPDELVDPGKTALWQHPRHHPVVRQVQIGGAANAQRQGDGNMVGPWGDV